MLARFDGVCFLGNIKIIYPVFSGGKFVFLIRGASNVSKVTQQ